MAARPTPKTPDSTHESVRLAYLDLLRLALCDLVYEPTETVYTHNGGPVSRFLPPDELSWRLEGRDWPLRGLTMIGYSRLTDLQDCLERVVADGIEGDVIEAGVWRGGASILARAVLNTLGEADREVWVADSFEGLPSPDEQGFPEDLKNELHSHDYLAAPLAEVTASFQRLGLDQGVNFVKGFFADTMSSLANKRWAVIRVDGDMYESTWVTLEALYPGLARGGYVIFDDYGEVDEGRRAMDDFRATFGIGTPLEWADHACVRWRREDDPEPLHAPELVPSRSRVSGPVVERPETLTVKSEREVWLEGEIYTLSQRLQELESEPAQCSGRARLKARLQRLAHLKQRIEPDDPPRP